ncbi:MAG: hypothetical protein JXQ23_11985 [Clostridia bacterium]|nr:hypothetical protein [Clostridia bacterium]
MKNKKVIIVLMVVAILLVGGIAAASFDENGNFVNPFTNILSQKVQNGELTQAEVDTFYKVFDAIHQDEAFIAGGKGIMDRDRTMLQDKELLRTRLTDRISQMVEDGIITSEQAALLNEYCAGGIDKEAWANLSDEQIASLKDALAKVREQCAPLRDFASKGMMGAKRGGRGFSAFESND